MSLNTHCQGQSSGPEVRGGGVMQGPAATPCTVKPDADREAKGKLKAKMVQCTQFRVEGKAQPGCQIREGVSQQGPFEAFLWKWTEQDLEGGLGSHGSKERKCGRKSTKAGGPCRQVKARWSQLWSCRSPGARGTPCPWLSPECGLEPGWDGARKGHATTQRSLASGLDEEHPSALCQQRETPGSHSAYAMRVGSW